MSKFHRRLNRCRLPVAIAALAACLTLGGLIAKAQDADDERPVAEWVLAKGGTVRLNVAGKLGAKLTAAANLPGTAIKIQEIDLFKAKIADADLARLAKLAGLRYLRLALTPITDAGLAHLSGLHDLGYLNLNHTKISSAGLKHLAGLKKLKTLDLGLLAIEAEDLATVGRLTALTFLNLDSCGTTDAGIAQLTGLSALETLNIDRSMVTDRGAVLLRHLPRLRWVNLNLSHITDVGLANLQQLDKLQDLSLSETLVSQVGVEAFRRALPKCKVDWRAERTAETVIGNGRLVGRRVIAVNESLASRLKPGLEKTEYAAASERAGGAIALLSPDPLVTPLSQPQAIAGLTAWKHDKPHDALAVGYLKIERPGDYAFRSTAGSGRAALWIGSALASGQGSESKDPRRMALPAGYVPIVSAGLAGSPDEVTVAWQPPGQAAFAPIPAELLVYLPQAEVPPQPLSRPKLAGGPLPPTVKPSPRVSLASGRELTCVAAEEFCNAAELPYLKNSVAYAYRFNPNESNSALGRVELKINEDTAVYLGMRWVSSTRSGDWSKEVLSEIDLEKTGWTLVGELTFPDPAMRPHWLYWRLCHKGERLVLRSRESFPPLVIVPTYRKSNPMLAAIPESLPATACERVLTNKVEYLVAHDRFEELEKLVAGIRQQRKILSDGTPLLEPFYWGCAPVADAALSKRKHERLEAWLAAMPKSIAAHLALAYYCEKFAWQQRGGGYASQVTAEGMRAFETFTQRAKQLTDQARGLDEKDSHLYSLEIQLAIDLGAQREAVRGILTDSAAVDPQYTYPFVHAARYFQPRWYGKPGELEGFAEWADQQTQAANGHAVYFRIVWATRYSHGSSVLEQFHFDWDRIKQGIADALREHPDAVTLYAALAELAFAQGDRPAVREAFAKIQQFPKSTEGFDIENLELYRRWAQDDYLRGDQESVYEITRNRILEVRWADDGNRWYVFDNNGTMTIVDAQSGRRLAKRELPGVRPRTLAIAGNQAAAVTWEGTLHCVDLDTGQELKLGAQPGMRDVAISSDGKQCLTAGTGEKVQFWNLASAGVTHECDTKPSKVTTLACLPSGEFVTGSRDGRLELWNLETRQRVRELAKQRPTIWRLRASPDGTLLATFSSGELSLWRLASGERIATTKLDVMINELAFSPDGKWVAAATGGVEAAEEGDVLVWDAASGKLRHTFRGHKAVVRTICFAPDSQTVASGSDDMTLRVWKLGPNDD